jgi:hypothetical protein
MALFPLLLLASRALELHKLEAVHLGRVYVPSDTLRFVLGLAGLVVCAVQALAVLFHYDKLLKDIRDGKV